MLNKEQRERAARRLGAFVRYIDRIGGHRLGARLDRAYGFDWVGNLHAVLYLPVSACLVITFEETNTMITALIGIAVVAGALTWFALTDFSGGKKKKKP